MPFIDMKHKHTYKQLSEAVAKSVTWAGVCRILDIPPATGSQTHLTRRAKGLGIDASHFTGNRWRKGKKFPDESRPIQEYLVKDSTIKSSTLRGRLIEEGIKERRCELCGLIEWNGEPTPLELDHKNSDHWDNTLDNLQILCPNCHAQVTAKRRGALIADLGFVEVKAADSNPAKICIDCGKEISHKATKCKSCVMRDRGTRIVWPSDEELQDKLKMVSYVSLARDLGVSDNAIRKHLKICGGEGNWNTCLI